MIPIYVSRISPKDATKRQEWQVADDIDTVTFHTPHGKVAVCWDDNNGVMRFIGTELQLFKVAGNVMDIDVIMPQDELP